VAVQLRVRSYYEGVRSELNPADGPSRGDFSILRKYGPVRVVRATHWPTVE